MTALVALIFTLALVAASLLGAPFAVALLTLYVLTRRGWSLYLLLLARVAS